MQGVETELQLVTMYRALVYRRAPGKHIHIGRCLTTLGHGIGSNQCFGTEQPVDTQQILWHIVGMCLGKGGNISIGIIAKGSLQLLTSLILGHGLIVTQTLQLVKGGTNHYGDIV